VARAVDYAVANGAEIINMSFVAQFEDQSLKDSLKRAYDHGVVIVTAAGNNQLRGADGTGALDLEKLYPICFDDGDSENWILGVSSANDDNQTSYFSNYGRCVDLVAPGNGVYSLARYSPQFGYEKTWGGPLRGTSFSAPIVAGAAALIKSLHPEWGAKEIIKILLATADEPKISSGTFINYPHLNVARAAATAFVSPATVVSDIFTFDKQGNIYRSQKGKKQLWARAPEKSKILELKFADLNYDRQPETAILLRRGKFYFLRLLKGNGDYWREFVLGDPSGRDRRIWKNLAFSIGVDGEYLLNLKRAGVKGQKDEGFVYDLLGNWQ